MDKISYTKFIKLSLSIAVSLTLIGCGDGSDEKENTASLTESSVHADTLYYAQDVFRQSTPNEVFYVDLSNSMESSDGSSVSLHSVTPLNEDSSCEITSLDQNGFSIPARSVKVCDYRYRVGPKSTSIPYAISSEVEATAYNSTTSGDGFAEGTARAAVGESTELLVPISAVTSSFTSVTIDIPTELGNSGYSLDTGTYSLSTTVTLPNGSTTNSTAIANPSLNTIEYTPGSGIPSGVERILYSYSDGSNVLSGSIDVAVSTTTNNAPVAESIRKTSYIHPDSGEEVAKVPYGKTVRFDVKDLISDPDGDTLHLVDIFSYGATISIPVDANSDGNAFNDTVFDFSSEMPGETSISYVVSDGKGGYATGVVQGYIANPYEAIYVASNSKIYLPPLLYKDAVDADISARPQTGNGTTALLDIDNAMHNWETANNVCLARGARLASGAELLDLYNENASGSLFTKHNWPIDVDYWTSETGGVAYTHRTANLATGVINLNGADQDDYYVSCIDLTPPGYPILFFGNEYGSDYLFDARVNPQLQFMCGGIVDSISQVGGAHIGGTGGNNTQYVDFDEIYRIVTRSGPNNFSPQDSLTNIKIYNKSNELLVNCGDGDYMYQRTTQYSLSPDEVASGLRATGGSYVNGFELWIDTK